jgi:hypothetical protein
MKRPTVLVVRLLLTGCGGCDVVLESSPDQSDATVVTLSDAAAVSDAQSEAALDEAGAAACADAGGQCTPLGAGGSCAIVGPEQACHSNQVTGSFCCALEGGSCSDGGIRAADYDQSCTTDVDCIAIAEGDSCNLCAFNCPNATIGVGGQAKYLSDIANTAAGISSRRPPCVSGCGLWVFPCCDGGRCQNCAAFVVDVRDGAAITEVDSATDAAADASSSTAADAADASAE